MNRNSISPQSPAWFDARLGKFTASNFGKLMAVSKGGKDGFSRTALNYIREKAREKVLKNHKKSLTSKPIKWGNRMEAHALKALANNRQMQVAPIGFLTHPRIEQAGATPDGILVDKSGKEVGLIEVKCPYNPKIHLKYYKKIKTAEDLKKVAFNYYWQIQGAMWIFDFDLCYFVSYDSRRLDEKRLLIVEINRNQEDVKLLEETLLKAIIKRDEWVEEYSLKL